MQFLWQKKFAANRIFVFWVREKFSPLTKKSTTKPKNKTSKSIIDNTTIPQHHKQRERIMVYLENLFGERFWNCEVEGTTVTTKYGIVGKVGRTVTKYFDSPREARAYKYSQATAKRQILHYHDVTSPLKKQNQDEKLQTPTPRKTSATAKKLFDSATKRAESPTKKSNTKKESPVSASTGKQRKSPTKKSPRKIHHYNTRSAMLNRRITRSTRLNIDTERTNVKRVLVF